MTEMKRFITKKVVMNIKTTNRTATYGLLSSAGP